MARPGCTSYQTQRPEGKIFRSNLTPVLTALNNPKTARPGVAFVVDSGLGGTTGGNIMETLVSDCGRRACSFVHEQDGMASTEYAVVLGLLVVAALGALHLLGGGLKSAFSNKFNDVPGAAPGS